MEKVLVISYLYHDGDILQLRVRTWNGRFGGDTKLYVGRDGLNLVAKELRGFPSGKDDSRETVLGAFGPDSAGGAARLRFFCKGGAGHAFAEIQIEADSPDESRGECVTLLAAIEAAAMDVFIPELEVVGRTLSGTATLRFSDL